MYLKVGQKSHGQNSLQQTKKKPQHFDMSLWVSLFIYAYLGLCIRNAIYFFHNDQTGICFISMTMRRFQILWRVCESLWGVLIARVKTKSVMQWI